MTQSKNVKTWQGGNLAWCQMGYLSPYSTIVQSRWVQQLFIMYQWANTMGKQIAPERLAVYCGFYAYPHRNGPSPMLNMDARHTTRHRGWCGGASNVFMGHFDIVQYLCTYTKWYTQYYVRSPTYTSEKKARKFEHVWKYIHGILVQQFQFRFISV